MTLTPRELQVLRLIATDVPYKNIAMRLGIAFKTVDRHGQRIRWKTGVHTRMRLAHWALARGLVKNLYKRTKL